MRRFVPFIVALCLLAAGALTYSVSAREICFPDKPTITACFTDPFSGYWETNGGLPVFGYPLTAARQERNPDLNVDLSTQWTERNRLEAHPANRPPFDILLGRMGAERLQQLGRVPALEGREPGPREGCLWFETTGHNVCDQVNGRGFKSYWETHGLRVPGLDTYGRSLQLFGYPLTTPRMETNAAGDTVLTQWFERARFEWHPQKQDEFKVLLGLLGSELRANPAVERPPSVFGAEINLGAVGQTVQQASEAGVSWVRYNGILWSEVEPTPGARDWSRLSTVENELRLLAARGLTPIVIVRSTPGWAQAVAGSACGPAKPSALGAFANFMRDLVARYSVPPYNVRYWELGNEPDVDPSLVPGDFPFGCWGDQSDPFYGGGYYAEMLKQVYPAIKQAHPTAQLMIGGLLLDCDPSLPATAEECKPAKFFEGILRGGGGSFFDIAAYHAYTYWEPGAKDWDRAHPSWEHRGGTLLGKLAFLRGIQAQYGVHKPILMNEGGLLCYPGSRGCPGDEFYAAQANYAIRMYSRTWASGLLGATWYTLNGPGWRDGGLLDRSGAPRPAYTTLKFMSTLLKDAVYTGQLSTGALEGYAFRKGNTTFQIYWSNDSTAHDVLLPAGTHAVYNQAGQQRSPGGTSLRVGFEPVVIEVRTP